MATVSILYFSGSGRMAKLAAGFTISGALSGDKFNTLQYFHTLAMQHGMIWIGLGELPGQPNGVNRLGSWGGAMAQPLDDDSGDIVPEDKLTGEWLGKRVATFAWKLQQTRQTPAFAGTRA
jgi:NAD(P)H dehydrogenase (quinone)